MRRVRLMFQDEAGFGRINKPKYCWCSKGIRPNVPCHHIREYRYAYGAVEPMTGENFFLIMPYCNTDEGDKRALPTLEPRLVVVISAVFHNQSWLGSGKRPCDIRINTECMNVFLEELSKQYPNDQILLVCDGAAWHKSKTLIVPENIMLLNIPPYTPEMNPIEQIWRELRTQGFRNEIFPTLEKVVDRLCQTINNLSAETVSSITKRDWICKIFN